LKDDLDKLIYENGAFVSTDRQIKMGARYFEAWLVQGLINVLSLASTGPSLDSNFPSLTPKICCTPQTQSAYSCTALPHHKAVL